MEWDGGGHGEGLFREKQNLRQPRPQYQSSLLPPPTPCPCLEDDFSLGGRRRQLSRRDGAESAFPGRPQPLQKDREGGRSLGRSGSSESSELTQGPESEDEGVRVTVNLDRRAAPAKGLQARGSAGVRGTPATQVRQHSTAHHTPQDRGSGWGYRGRQAEKLDARQTSSTPPPPAPQAGRAPALSVRPAPTSTHPRIPHHHPAHPAKAPTGPSGPRRVITSPGGGVGGGSSSGSSRHF